MRKFFTNFFRKLLLVFLVWISFLSCQSKQLDRVEKERDLFLSVFLILSQNHFLQKNFNQNFFNEVLTNYLQVTDWQKNFYLQSEVDLFYQLGQYSSEQDNYEQEILNRIPNLLKISYQSYEIFQNRVSQFQTFAENYLDRKIDFSIRENYNINPEKRFFSTDEQQLKESWRKYLKYLTLNQLLLVTQNKGKEGNSQKNFISNEAKSREQILVQIKSIAQNLRTRKSDQYLEFYLNAVGMAYDRYTSYYSPIEKENFNINMTGQLEGIGAQITKVEDGLIEIKGIVPGGPTYKQKALKVGDKIMKIDNGKGKMLEVVFLSMNEALTYIRGKKGTIAKFVVKRINGVIENVEITRDRVVLEERYARSAVIETQIKGSPSKKIGYLYLPSFYGNRQNSQFPNSSDDIKRGLLYLNSQGVSGLVFDLRNNGGGYLEDAVSISGFFIEQGPVVRIRGRNREFKPRSDNDPTVVFTKPLVVMINENSASASEIFSAAMQDYGRGVVIGTAPQSFGKATVQTILEYDKQNHFKKVADIAGSLKYTIQKYYRVTGKSTQTIGVIPDLILPSLWIKKEKNLSKNSYARDSLSPIPYKKWDRFSYDISKLYRKEQKRIKKSPFFLNVEMRLKALKERQNEDVVPLSYDQANFKREKYLKEIDKYDLNIPKPQTNYIVLKKIKDSQNTKDKGKEDSDWNKQILGDYYLEESIMVLNDIIQ